MRLINDQADMMLKNFPIILIHPLLGALGGSQMHQSSPNFKQNFKTNYSGVTPPNSHNRGGERTAEQTCHMSANHSDCRYANRVDRVPVTGTRYLTLFLSPLRVTLNALFLRFNFKKNLFRGDTPELPQSGKGGEGANPPPRRLFLPPVVPFLVVRNVVALTELRLCVECLVQSG